MRLKNLLTFLVLLSVSLGMRAYSGTGNHITLSDIGSDTQSIVTTEAGALSAWYEALTDEQKASFRASTRTKLVISGPLNAYDLAVLNSTNEEAWGHFTTLDMSTAVISSDDPEARAISVVKDNLSMGNLEYLRLPNSMTDAEDVEVMATMRAKNGKLKMVGAYDPDNSEYDITTNKWAEVAMHSFEANKVADFLTTMNMPTSGNPTIVPRKIRMSGEFGVNDLVNNGTPNFGYGTSAEWDFTGAHFADCTIADATQDAAYYNYDDPFCDGELVKCPTTTNAFYYFSQYKNQVVDLKLPDTNMTHLPFRCLNDLASDNGSGYKALYGEAAFEANKEENKFVPMETLRIPDCYTDLDEECGKWARIRHLYVGSGMKRIHGGAFLKCDFLEDLDFAAGLSDCYIGDRAFNECRSMKHIALSEGIVSLGNGCFWNSQHLESIRLPQSLIDMGNHCFDNCLALNSITIPENVEKIGKAAFNLCPFTDIYLTTTDPAKIPYVWSAGTKFTSFDGNCTFHHGHVDGWEGGIDGDKDKIDGKMTWEEAAEFYFTHWNGMPVLHFPQELAEKVRSEISSQYALKTKADEHGKQYGLPMRVDMDRRDNIPGADLGTDGAGKYTQDGWAQFMMMKEFTTKPGGDVYPKYYEDVWYTMCFPFDLTDEQLAAAFNETFNIVDFSGVEVMEKDDPKNETGNLTLTLHFNTVAKTYYRDSEGNEYNVIGREKDEVSGFSYNIYEREGKEYHHSQVSAQLSSNKTKTFAEGNSITEANANKDNAFIIDGYLATAGHPYMIHPAIGTAFGNPKRCDFSGVVWKPQTQWANIFEAQKREVDLGVPKGSCDVNDIHDHSKWTPDEYNYMQPAYSKYAGQTYTFIGNPAEFDAEAVATYELEDEPQVPEKPVPAVKPTAEEIEALKPSETLDEPHATVDNPETNTKYSDEFKELYNTVRCANVYLGYIDGKHVYRDYTYGEDLNSYEYTDFLEFHNWSNTYAYCVRSAAHNIECDNSALKTYIGGGDELTDLGAFNALKQLAVDYKSDKTAWATYETQRAAYISNRAAWAYYNAQKEIYDSWNQTEKDQEYQDALNYYNNQTAAHEAWVTKSKKYQRLIPTGAYFLGRKSDSDGNPIEYPRYYREIADDQRAFENRNGGYWSQFTAVIIPNDAAINGIEKQLGPGIANNTKALNMVFDEGFMGEFDPTEIKDIVADAEEKGQKVEYMNIVYSINGEVVGHGSHSLSNLPQGMYIINGKKYLVK